MSLWNVLEYVALFCMLTCMCWLVYNNHNSTETKTKIACLIPTERLPQNVWSAYQKDHLRGSAERGHRLRITNMWILVPSSAVKHNYQAAKAIMKKHNIKQLYHGTSRRFIESICTNGFVLPSKTKSNMFGPGVYMAQVPQKSYDYTGNKGYILICNVAVGKARIIKHAQFLDPSKDLETRRLFGLFKHKYDSAHAPAGMSTISDEHIIFHPERILPAYLIKTRRVL